ncbi:MAG: Clp protease [Barrevirus sp.]|uniref:Clp protease n=1 Tax=Barrevirus sp. TaxID=2487763 RepID=A0A3G4ZQ56_9VIRU|nr:MAG: Clp protease [Barrevirus sp.]
MSINYMFDTKSVVPSSIAKRSSRSSIKRNIQKRRRLDELLKDLENKHNDDSDSDNEDGDNEDDFYFDTDVSCKDNRIFFKTNVTQNSVEKLIKIIESKVRKFKKVSSHKMIKSAEPTPIYLHITSYGGDLFACFRAVDAIIRSEIPIYTVVDGYAASAATLMSIAGKKRYMTPSSYMLIHQLSSGASGKFWEIKDDFENCETWMNDIYNLYTEHTNLTREQLEEYLSHDLWWKVDQCIESGLVDSIYTNDKIL